MANLGIKGIDVRQTLSKLLLEVFMLDNANGKVSSGTAYLYIYEVQDDGSLKSYDFNDNTFKTGALTNETSTLTHQQGNNNTTNTGIWTKILSTLTGFTVGAVYIFEVYHAGAIPQCQARKFQFGSTEGDDGAFAEFVVGASSSATGVRSNRTEADDFWNGNVIAFTSGTYKGLARKISDFANTNGEFTVTALPGSPSAGDRGIILGRIE
jgi:hypothetical protein